MGIRRIKRSIVEATELPRVVQLKDNLFAGCFQLMKLLPARFILDRARDAGLLKPGSTIIETTSGTFGLALSMLCALRGYRLILVSDPVIDEPLKRRMEYLGTQVEIVRTPAAAGGYQRARLDRMAELQAENPDHFWPSQYDNPHNPGAYAVVSELLTETVGHIDCLVGTVGSGGSMSGTSYYLRTLFPHLHVVGVDTPGSVLFGQADGKRMLRGLGNSLMPQNLEHSLFDEAQWVPAADAFLATRRLLQKHALYMGGTSGAAYMVASWWAEQHPDARVVVLFPDEGHRYQDTIYNEDWLRAQSVWAPELPFEPRTVSSPLDAGADWCRFDWSRRSYQQVLAASAHALGKIA